MAQEERKPGGALRFGSLTLVHVDGFVGVEVVGVPSRDVCAHSHGRICGETHNTNTPVEEFTGVQLCPALSGTDLTHIRSDCIYQQRGFWERSSRRGPCSRPSSLPGKDKINVKDIP